MKSKLFCRLIPCTLILLCFLSVNAVAGDKVFQFDPITGKATIEILQELKSQHYKKIPIDDHFASLLMDAYLEALDPAKVIFTAQDIQEFRQQSSQLDNQISEGNLAIISAIYNRFYQRNKFILAHTLKDTEHYANPYPDSNALIELDRKTATWPANLDESLLLWDKRIFNEALSLKISGKAVDAIPELLKKRYEERMRRLNALNSEDVYEIFANALTSLYDPHSDWMSPKAEANFKISMSLSLEGIGAVLQMDEEKTKVVSLVTAGPAAKSGQISPGDFILAVGQDQQGDMQDVIGWRLDEVVEQVRGAKGSFVRLQVENAETKALKLVTLQREQIKLEDQAAKSAEIEIPSPSGKSKKIGIINVPAFYMNFDAYKEGDADFRSTTKDVLNLLEKLKKDQVDGIVLDLRNNGGGSLKESATFTNLFVDPGPVVQIKTSNDFIDRNNFRAQNPAFYKGPLLLLINHLSASATEIFAGAIQDYHRGLIVGEQSFGKGTVQTIADLDYGELKLTTAKFYRVSGESTQHRGVIPDIAFPSPFDFKLVGESALDNALPWDSIHAIAHYQYDDPNIYRNALEKNHIDRMNSSPDYQALLKRIDFIKEKQGIKTLSLNEKTRLEERKKDDETLLAITNTLRIKKGQKPFKTIEELEKEDADRAALTTSKTTIDTQNDFLLLESAKILSDLIDDQQVKSGKAAVADSKVPSALH